MSATTSVWNVDAGTEWRIWRSWRRAAKHLDTVRWTCVRIDKSRSRYIPRSRTYIAGMIGTSSINMADIGSWCSGQCTQKSVTTAHLRQLANMSHKFACHLRTGVASVIRQVFFQSWLFKTHILLSLCIKVKEKLNQRCRGVARLGKLWRGKIVCVLRWRLKESSDGDTLMAAGVWFQIWEAAEEKARRLVGSDGQINYLSRSTDIKNV